MVDVRQKRRPDAPGAEAARRLGDLRARPNVRWLSQLLGRPASEVLDVLSESSSFADVDRAIRQRHLERGRTNYAQFRAPLELYTLVRFVRPDHVVETGVSSGVSSAHILLALRRNRKGRLHSIDLPTPQRGPTLRTGETPVALPIGCHSGWAVPEALRVGWDLRIGPSEKLLPRLVRSLSSIGLFLHDSRHTPRHLAFELATVAPRLAPGAIVLADNTMWTGQAFPQFARKVGATVLRRGRSDLVGLRMPESRGSAN